MATRLRTAPPKHHHVRARYQVRVPIPGFTRGRAITRYAHTYRQALRIANEELGAGWTSAADELPVATIRQWSGKQGKYQPGETFERPELDGVMISR